MAILEAYGNGGPGNPLVPVVTLPEGTTVDSPGTRDALARAFAGVAADPRLRVLAWPATTGDRRLVVDGGRIVYALVWGPFQGQEGGDPAIWPSRSPTASAGPSRPAPTVQVTGLDAAPGQPPPRSRPTPACWSRPWSGPLARCACWPSCSAASWPWCRC